MIRGKRSGYGWFELIVGILLVVLGIATFFHPERTLTIIVIFCGILAIATGISDIVFYVKAAQFTGFGPMLSLITGVFSIMVGSMLLMYPSSGAYTMILLMPVWFIAHCISRLTHLSVVHVQAGSFYYYFSMVVNIIGIILGILMVLRPVFAVYTSGVVLGVYLVLLGVDSILTAISDLGGQW